MQHCPPSSCSCASCLRQPNPSRTAASLSLNANERRRCSTVAVSAAAADLWRDVWAKIGVGAAWATTFPHVKSNRTSLFEVVYSGLTSEDDRTGHDFAAGARKLVVFSHRARLWFWQAKRAAGSAVTCMAHRVGSCSLMASSRSSA